jgi:hypothetical protein
MNAIYLQPLDTISNMSKGELAAQLYPDITYDCALPQSWVDGMYQRGFDNVASLFVWGYPDNDSNGYPLPLCTEAMCMLAQVSRYV